jgi:cephalosporin hydroxylase
MESTSNAPAAQESPARTFLNATLRLRQRLGLTRPQIACFAPSRWLWTAVTRSHPLVLTSDLFPQETAILLESFKESRPLTYLEIGVFWGGTFRKVLAQRDVLSFPTKCFGLDIWDEVKDSAINTHTSGCPSREAVRCALAKRGFKNFELLSGLSSQVGDLIDCKIDFVFHDANHTYAAVRDDLELLYPLMSDGATMVVHNAGRDFEPDKSYYQADGGPYQAVMDLVKLGKWDLKKLEYRVAVLKKLP